MDWKLGLLQESRALSTVEINYWGKNEENKGKETIRMKI